VLTLLVLPAEGTDALSQDELRGLEYLLLDALSEHARSMGSPVTALRYAVNAATHLETLMDELGAAEAVRLCGDLRHSPLGARVVTAATYVSGVASRIRAA
jgi:hypothetical protein